MECCRVTGSLKTDLCEHSALSPHFCSRVPQISLAMLHISLPQCVLSTVEDKMIDISLDPLTDQPSHAGRGHSDLVHHLPH